MNSSGGSSPRWRREIASQMVNLLRAVLSIVLLMSCSAKAPQEPVNKSLSPPQGTDAAASVSAEPITPWWPAVSAVILEGGHIEPPTLKRKRSGSCHVQTHCASLSSSTWITIGRQHTGQSSTYS